MRSLSEKNWLQTEFPTLTQARPEESNKGTFGTLHIIGSGPSMNGATILAGRAALKSGCGKVIIGFNQNPPTVTFVENVPELILHDAKTLITELTATAWVIGCGLGTDQNAKALMTTFMATLQPHYHTLIDADGLNLISRWETPITLSEQTVITPHPMEAARLLHTEVNTIQADRQASVLKLSQHYGCWAVLKGHQTQIASPTGQTWINDTGNSGLATAGSGDVLSGIIGSLLAQKFPMEEAVRAGVWLHGKAADNLVKKGIGPIGLTAHEIIDEVRSIRNAIVYSTSS